MITRRPGKNDWLVRLRENRGAAAKLRLVPMIDVVFLLLIFFLLAANFRSREGFLPAELPRRVVHHDRLELEPLLIELDSPGDGSCHIQIGQEPPVLIDPRDEEADFKLLSSRLKKVLDDEQRSADDPIRLVPTARTKWDHVVKAYDAIWQLDLHNIIFTVTE